VIDQERKDSSHQKLREKQQLAVYRCEIKNVILDRPATVAVFGTIEFEKGTNPADHTELKRERWTASVTYVFREKVKNQ